MKIIGILLISVVTFIQIGCNSLTERMWTGDKMVVKEEDLLEKTLKKNRNSDTRFIELKSGKTVKLEVLKDKKAWGNQLYERDIAGEVDIEAFTINDFSKVPLDLREKSSFSYLIFPSTATCEEEILVNSIFFRFRSQILEQTPKGLSSYSEKDRIVVKYWVENRRDTWGVTWRCVATPFTVVADIILVPSCYIYGYYDMWSNFPH